MMGHPMEKSSCITFEWFLKRIGIYIQDITISLHQEEIILGRGKNEGVQYALGISRRHALFRKTADGGWEVKDLGSTNGVFINATKIPIDHFEPIKEFDIIGLGVADARGDEYFTFMLCRRPNCQRNKSREIEKIKTEVSKAILSQEIPQSKEAQIQNGTTLNEDCNRKNLTVEILMKQGNRTIIRSEQNLQNSTKQQIYADFQSENNFNANSDHCNKGKNSTGFSYSSSKTAAADVDDVPQFQRSKSKKRRVVIIISSDDTDRSDEDDIPQKNYKLRKKRKRAIRHQECHPAFKERSSRTKLLSSTEKEPESFFSSSEGKEINSTTEVLEEQLLFQLGPRTLNPSVQRNNQTLEGNNCSTKATDNISQEDKLNRKTAIKNECLGMNGLSSFLSAIDSSTNHERKSSSCEPGIRPTSSQLSDEKSIMMYNADGVIAIDFDDIIVISDDEDFIAIKQEQDMVANVRKECANVSRVPVDARAISSSILQSKCNAKEFIVQEKDKTAASADFPFSGDETPVRDTVDDSFNFWDEIDLGINEEELLNRLQWPPEPDSCKKENELFPELSVKSDAEDRCWLPNEEIEHANTKSQIKQSSSHQLKSIAKQREFPRTQLIEALPMTYRPSYIRGQGEWFIERTSNAAQVDMPVNANDKKDFETMYAPKTRCWEKTVYEKQPSKFGYIACRENLSPMKERTKRNMQCRNACPGGRTVMVKEDMTNRLQVASSTIAVKSIHGSSESKLTANDVERSPLVINNAQASNISKNAHKQVQRFQSRNERLLQSMMINDTSHCKNADFLDGARRFNLDRSIKNKETFLKTYKIPKKKFTEQEEI